jgi:hypothetical protein
VKHTPPTRRLPDRPDLGQLKRQAKELLAAFLSRDPDAVAEVNRFYHEADAAAFALHDAQLVMARAHGYDSWPKLKAYVDGVTIQRLVEAVRANDLDGVRAILRVRPELVNTVERWNYEYTALHYAVLERMPEMTRLLMRFGADPHAGISPHNEATSAWTIATERGFNEIAAILREEEQRRDAAALATDEPLIALRRAMRSGDEDQVIAAIERYPELVQFQMPGNRRTPLHLASALLLRRTVARLLDLGTNVNVRAADGTTPLDVAGMLCDTARRAESMADMIEFLKDRGAEMTPRSAVILGDEGFLRARHADGSLPEPQDDQGWLLRLAVDCDRPDIL